jgi:CHASE2 domain-containing sensor protein
MITAAVLLLEHFGYLESVQSVGIDRFVRVFPSPQSTRIFIVEITDEDYKESFHNRSPLDAVVVARLLNNLEQAHAKVIGVDLDTSDTPMGPLLRERTNIFWAEVPEIQPRAEAPPQLIVTPILANVWDTRKMGIPLFPQDADGLVRHFQDSFKVWNNHTQQSERIPSLSCAMARALGANIACGDDAERRFSFAGDRFHFQTVEAGEILSSDSQAPWKTSVDLTGSIVLVGGRYRAARDEYVTPAGAMAGVEVVANAAQSYLEGGRSYFDSIWVERALFDLLTGTFVIWLYWRFRIRLAFWLSITLAPVAAMAASVLAFLCFHRWLAFVPVLIGIVIHELHDHAEHVGEIETLERRAEGLRHLRFSSLFVRRSRYRPPGRS